MKHEVDLKKNGKLGKDFILRELAAKGHCLIENIDLEKVRPLLKELGELFIQEAGQEHLVEYNAGYEEFRYSKSMNEIGPHSEYPYYNIPPKIQVLYAIKPSDCEGGQTYTCHTERFIKNLSHGELEMLSSIQIDFKANTDLQNAPIRHKAFPVLTQSTNGSYIFRFSHNLFYYGDVNANIHSEKKGDFLKSIKNQDFQLFVKKFLDYFEKNKQVWSIPKKGLLLWNNHKVVHARASYNDSTRKLLRFLLT